MLLEITNAILVLIIIYITGKYIHHLWDIRSFPPGPFPLPVVGNLHVVLKQPLHTWAHEMAKKYGSILSISLGMQRIVIVNTIDPTLESLVKKSTSFSGRPTNYYYIELLSRGFNDIAFSDYGEMWKNRRKLGHAAVIMINDDKGNTEKKIVKESEELHLRIHAKQGKPINMKKELGNCIINIMSNVLFSKRYDPDDEELIDLISMNSQIVSSFAPNDPNNWINWLRYIYQTESYLRLKDALAKRDKYISRYLREHLKTYKEGLKRDFTDYLIELSRQKKSASVATDSDLEMILSDMIIAGSETTLTSLEWMIVCLIRWPEYQDKLFHDIVNNIDTGRYPCIKNKVQFHFVQAFIHEVLRFVSFIPLCPPHKTIEDENIATYNIPKGTIVFYNIWAIHHQEEVFPNSKKFNPNRWLDRDGHFQNSKSFMIFSVGKRACLGENLARKEMFLFLTRLVRDFEIHSEPHAPRPDFEGITGGTIFPKPFNVVFQSRPS